MSSMSTLQGIKSTAEHSLISKDSKQGVKNSTWRISVNEILHATKEIDFSTGNEEYCEFKVGLTELNKLGS